MSEQKIATQPAATLQNGIPDLGTALLAPGPLARKAESKIVLSAVIAPVQTTSTPEPVSKPALSLGAESKADINWPRSPEEIQRSIAAGEIPEARTTRILEDKMRWRWQRGLD